MARSKNSKKDAKGIFNSRQINGELKAEAIVGKPFREVNPERGIKHAQLAKNMKGGISFHGVNISQDADATLREGEELHAKLLAVIPDPVIRTDIEGKILFVNDMTLQKSGYGREEFIGQSVFSFLAPEDQPRAIDNMKLLFERPLRPKEYRFIAKSGAIIHIEVNGDILRNEEGTPNGTVQVCRDITERKKTEQSLKEWEERYRLLSEASFEGVAITDRGIFVDANKQMLDMLGYSHEEIVGRPVSDIIAPESVDLVMKNILNEFEEPYENYLRKKDGTCFPVVSRARSMFWGDRKCRGYRPPGYNRHKAGGRRTEALGRAGLPIPQTGSTGNACGRDCP